jgi:AcrR family transcriptional regulator
VSPRPPLGDVRKPQILAAAVEALHDRGFQATRIADVAQRAGTSSPAVLYYFASKDEVLEQALEYADTQAYDAWKRAFEALPRASDKLRFMVESSAHQRTRADDWTLWIEMWARALRRPQVRAHYERLDRRMRLLVADVIRDGQAAGEFRACDADDAALTLSALLDGLGVQRTLDHEDLPPERMVDLCLRWVARELECDLNERDGDHWRERSAGDPSSARAQ